MHPPSQLCSARPGRLVIASALALACTESSAPRNPRTVAGLEVTSGSGQEAEVGTPLTNPIGFLATDSAGARVWGATIRFSVTGAGSSASPATAQTNRDGIARVRWTLGSEAGTQALVAVVGPPGEEVTTTVTATARPGAVVSLGADVTPGSIAVTVGDTTPIVFRGVDRFGNVAGPPPAGTARFAWNVDHPEVAEVVATEELSAADPPHLRARVVGRGVGTAVAGVTVTGLGAGALAFRFDLRAYAGPGRDLAFAFSPRPRFPPRIAVLTADGTHRDLGEGSHPAWSPDGSEIAFITPFVQQVAVMNADGSGRRTLTTEFDGKWSPAWSPDGQRIAFVTGTGNFPVVCVMNRDGSGIRTIDADPCGGSCWSAPERLAWSPDGALIAYSVSRFASGIQGAPPEIILGNADGSGTRRFALADGTPISGASPAWSPDGRSLAFTLGRSLTSQPGAPGNPGEIVAVGLDGTGLRRVTRTWGHWDEGPDWSPDGRIALVRGRARSDYPVDLLGIYVVNADGTELRRVSRLLSVPAWRPTP